MRATALAVILLVAPLAGCLASPDPDRPLSTAVVASSHPLASEAGATMLRAGGSAVDAAAAVQWVLNVVEPSMSGMGGGALLLVYDPASGTTHAFDGRELAPAAVTRELFQGRPPSEVRERQGYAVGVPGTLRVFDMAHERFGGLPWARTFEPAIAIAEEGFEVDPWLEGFIAAGADELRSWPASAELYLAAATCPPEPIALLTGCTGLPKRAGDTITNPDIADTFRAVAEQGADAFYEGDIADDILATLAARQGLMTAGDIASYQAKERAPLVGTYRGHSVVGFPPPAAGGVTTLQVLGMLEGFDLAPTQANDADSLHLLIEAMQLAYADRYAFLGDGDAVRVPLAGLLHPDYLAERRVLIDPARAQRAEAGDPWRYEEEQPGAQRPAPSAEGARARDAGGHTTHFLVVDGSGMVVAVTSTIESLWGTGMTVPGRGFLLNDELTDFDYAPGGPNEPGPGKRPLSSMSPTIVLRDGEPLMTLGSPGGQTIPQSVLQVLVHVLDHGLSLEDAVAAARVYSPRDFDDMVSMVVGDVDWDRGLATDVREALRAKGHEVARVEGGPFGNVQAALVDHAGAWTAVADDRAAQGSVVYVAPDEVVAR